MKKLFINLTFLSAIVAFFLFLSNCSEDKESSSQIVGIWNVTSVDFDAFVGNMTLEDYYLNELGWTQQETDIAMAMFDDDIRFYLESTMIEFESDYWYWTNIGDPAGDDGSWSINDSETLIILDEGTIWETQVIVNSLSSTSLNISFTMTEEMDLDDDFETDDVEVTFDMTMSLTKQ
jgi:hypothetical protein